MSAQNDKQQDCITLYEQNVALDKLTKMSTLKSLIKKLRWWVCTGNKIIYSYSLSQTVPLVQLDLYHSATHHSSHSSSGQAIDPEGQLSCHASIGEAAKCPSSVSAGSAQNFHMALSSIRYCKLLVPVSPSSITVETDRAPLLDVSTLPFSWDIGLPWESQISNAYELMFNGASPKDRHTLLLLEKVRSKPDVSLYLDQLKAVFRF